MASEMLYPIMPIFLKSIGFSVVLIGILEGMAEAIAGFSKGYFGKMSDTLGRRVPFVQLGYGLSAISKPMMALFSFPIWIFLARTIDRIGKGLRTGARDAILSDEATKENKGKVFGFHRSMDTFGAVLGPSLALIFLYFYPEQYRTLFLLAFIPGVLAIIASFFLTEKQTFKPQNKPFTPLSASFNYWSDSNTEYKKLVVGLLAFALANSSDVFLLLKIKQAGINDYQLIGVYIFYNLVYALFAFPVGIIADKFGLKTTFLVGLMLFVTVYLGMAFTQNLYGFYVLFFIYGIYAAATEGISKAWISNIVPQGEVATAIGTYTGFQSIIAMLASSLAGILWYKFGENTTFIFSVFVVILVIIYMASIAPTTKKD